MYSLLSNQMKILLENNQRNVIFKYFSSGRSKQSVCVWGVCAEPRSQVKILDEIVCISLPTNAFQKGMNLSLLHMAK